MDLARSHFAPRVLVLAVALLLVAFTGTALADDIQVTSADGGTGTCPSSDQCTLRTALDDASIGDVIHVPAFHIHLGIHGQLASDTSDLTIVGAGAQSTIIDGDTNSRVFEFDENATLRNLTVTNGTGVAGGLSAHPAATPDNGGGIWSAGGTTLTIDHVAVTHNTAGAAGGGIYGFDLDAQYSEISNNDAGDSGGGVHAHNVDMFNSTLSDNSVTGTSETTAGGGVYAGNFFASLNNTISGNRVTSGTIHSRFFTTCSLGAGFASICGDSGAHLQNTILSDNKTDGSADNCNTSNNRGSTGGNVADDDSCGLTSLQDKPHTDPALAGLALNGGQTQTRAIGSDSPAFNNGVSGSTAFGPFGGPSRLTCPSNDQRDFTRPAFGACDSGAFELQPTTPTITPVTPVVTAVTAAKSCVDVRKFKFKLHKFRKARIINVVVFINGKKMTHKKGHNLRTITINKLPQQVFKVKIVSTQSTQSKLISTRTYNGCIKSKPKTTAFHINPHHRHGH